MASILSALPTSNITFQGLIFTDLCDGTGLTGTCWAEYTAADVCHNLDSTLDDKISSILVGAAGTDTCVFYVDAD
ncbi:Uu.00g108240.m01.CDS01 [Anthostomella pinea]|uniref:Uu.00g108240.m01.CDS01 n=1 Tax=Anthostomella pinea TaxID=933095 RepID=A0AAI8VEJ5_9PEZI|nr:Uu.00g108240.m01.CDS01 [Anthostomella pinea]